MIKYRATGMVWGNLWGGGQGGYPAETLESDTREELIGLIDAGLLDGTLDSGMGYESLVGAVMVIDEIDTRQIDGKIFVAIESDTYVRGDLSDQVQECIFENL